MEENAAHQENDQLSVAAIWDDFVLLGRCKVSVVKGSVHHFFRTGIFPRSGWVSLTWVVCTVPRLQVCARGSSQLISG